jgi:hypothetical protein
VWIGIGPGKRLQKFGGKVSWKTDVEVINELSYGANPVLRIYWSLR